MKSGFVAILGRPNVGKSTIINGLISRHISIVTDKSQTTRNNIIGVYNDADAQIVFLDTPGIHKPVAQLGQEMNNMAYSAAHDVDVAILVVDASKPFGAGDTYIIEHLDIHNVPLIIVFNKIDLARLDKTEELKKTYRSYFKEATFIDTVAKEGFNLDELVNKVKSFLKEGPAYYPVESQVCDTHHRALRVDVQFTGRKFIRPELAHHPAPCGIVSRRAVPEFIVQTEGISVQQVRFIHRKGVNV